MPEITRIENCFDPSIFASELSDDFPSSVCGIIIDEYHFIVFNSCFAKCCACSLAQFLNIPFLIVATGHYAYFGVCFHEPS